MHPSGSYPTLRERVRDVLLAAGFKARQDTIPAYSSGGTFDLTSGAVVRVQVSWWDATPDQERVLLESFAAALEQDGFTVTRRDDVLLVVRPEKRSDEKERRG